MCDLFWNIWCSYVAKCSGVIHKKVWVAIDCIPEVSVTVLVTLTAYPSPPILGDQRARMQLSRGLPCNIVRDP